jgi:flagellar motor component MotA
MQIKELLLEGVVAIIEGLNPQLIRTKLESYTRETAYGCQAPKPVRKTALAAASQSEGS